MTFKKNLFTIIVAIVLVLLGTWLVNIPRDVIVNGMTLVIATMIMTLMLEDFWRKMMHDSALVTWQYVLGMLFVGGSVLGWLWASESITTKEMVIRLGVTFLGAAASGFIFYGPYKVSVGEGPDSEQRQDAAQRKLSKQWARWKNKIAKSNPVDAHTLLRDRLRWFIVGDTIDGDLDYNRPFGLVDGVPCTYNELRSVGYDETKLDEIDRYLKTLIGE